ncbi:hypothetical protein AB1Y20_014437 [Prymnesium parvum]|uniref:Neurotransmitter-gated ion-channel transmembrane domain-containing protein n=1 Tax=Prymnesium parvum TaxID=97485 RepID=A0AB34IGB6_PRYPA
MASPPPPPAPRCEVRVRCSVRRLLRVSLQEQTFRATLHLEASWVEPELKQLSRRHAGVLHADAARSNQRQGVLVVLEDKEGTAFFAPRLALVNQEAGGAEAEEGWFTVFDDAPEAEAPPVVTYQWVTTSTFQETMDLRLFPMDVQDLGLLVQSFWEETHPTNAVALVENKKGRYMSFVNTFDFVQASEYRLFNRVGFRRLQSDPAESSSLKTYSRLLIVMRVNRYLGYWLFNVIAPLFILTSSLFASYAFEPEELEARTSITVTMLLSMVAFKYVISEQLPSISYATLVDWYVFCCFLCSYVVMVEQVLAKIQVIEEPRWTYTSAVRGAAEPASCSICLVVGTASWIGAHLLAFVVLLCVRIRRRAADQFWTIVLDALWLGPLDESCANEAAAMEMLLQAGVVGCRRIHIWTAEAAREALPHYNGSGTFAVLAFANAAATDGAKSALEGLIASGSLPGFARKDSVVEKLLPGYYELAQRQRKRPKSMFATLRNVARMSVHPSPH